MLRRGFLKMLGVGASVPLAGHFLSNGGNSVPVVEAINHAEGENKIAITMSEPVVVNTGNPVWDEKVASRELVFVANNGNDRLTYEIAHGKLPDGLTLTKDGVISGVRT